MDDRRVGRIFREVRIHRRWRQADLARAAGVSQGVISFIEHGRLERVSLSTLRSVGSALDIRVGIDAWWRSGEIDRLLDRAHAALVEQPARELRDHGWLIRPEVTFNVSGERGSADLVAWHPARRALLIGEAKTRFGDVQEMHASFDRKVRILPNLLRREHGWDPVMTGRLLVVAATHANRDVVRMHEATLDATWPERTAATRRWIRRPVQGFRGGILFVPVGALDPRAAARVTARVRRS